MVIFVDLSTISNPHKRKFHDMGKRRLEEEAVVEEERNSKTSFTHLQIFASTM
jgi:hypothetical protein